MSSKRLNHKTLFLMIILALTFVALMAASSGAAVGAVYTSRTYTLDADFDEGVLVGVEHNTVPDQLQLTQTAVTLPFIWVPNQNCTVSKVNTSTGDELGRYRVAPHSTCSASRTTVDLQGNCWVGNRQAGTVVQMGLDEAGQCIDRDNSGTIETSRDLNSDGDITGAELLPWGQDECVLHEVVLIPGKEGTFVPGTYAGGYDYNYWGTAPRGLAVDASNNLWAGTWSSQKYYHINGSTGAIMSSLDVAPDGHSAYGAVIDGNGILWSARLSSHILRIDPVTSATSKIPLSHTYGLGLDQLGHLFVGGSRALSRIDTTTASGTLEWIKSARTVRGVASTPDNDVWVAGYDNFNAYRGVSRYDNNGNLIVTIDGFNSPSGVAVDNNGKVWVTDINSENIYRINPATNSVDLTKQILGSGGHYTYSDMTGYVARTITTKLGTWNVVQDSGVAGTPWGTINWNTESEGSEPAGTSITVEARAADTQAGLGAQSWVPVSNGVDFNINGRYLEVRATLQADNAGISPVLSDIHVQVGNQPPVADPNGPYDGCEGSSVSFDGTGSNDPDGDPLIYDWDWGDGTQTLNGGPTPSHTYDDNGTYDVCLTVTDPFGLTDTVCTSQSANLNVVFALDSSGSMGWNDPSGLRRTAAKDFLDKMNAAYDLAGVVSWDGGIDFTYGLTSDFTTLKTQINAVNSSGGTNLDVGLTASINMLDSGKQAGASWVIIFLSNGEGSYSGGPTASAAAKGYKVYSIGLGPAPATTYLTHMATQTGGQYYPAPTAENLQAIFDEIYTAVAGVSICNVPPTATFNAPATVNEGDDFNLSLTSPSDPSGADTTAGFEYAFDCGDGSYSAWSSSNVATCSTTDDATLTVRGKIKDKDGGESEYTATVEVLNKPPVVSVDVPSRTIQYSDYIGDIVFTATDVAADVLTASFDPDPLLSLSLTANGCSASLGVQTCTWTLSGPMDQPVGDYAIEVTIEDDDGGSGSATTTITVVHEDADIWLDDDNLATLEVDAPGGDSPAFNLTAYVKETEPDVAAYGSDYGDIYNAEVTMTLTGVGPGPSYTVDCTKVGVSGSGYATVLEVSCDFDDVVVNTYHVTANVVGNYYVGGPAEAIITVYDPSLGFITGGGWFYWPGTDDKTNYGFNVKFSKKGNRAKGSLLLIRHTDEGNFRVKSNAMQSLSVGEGTDIVLGDFGWASFSGKATYKEPGWPEPLGNYFFITYVEDYGEPGVNDRFWIEVQDSDGVIQTLALPRDAVSNAEVIDGGNIVVPHVQGKKN